MPHILKSSSPAKPGCNPEITGTPPATDAPNSICCFISRARLINSGPQWAMSCLLAVTTDLPDASARRIQSSVGRRLPITSTTTSTSEDRTSSIFSVHCTEDGSQSTFFRATLRLRMCVRRRWVLARSQRILATELPTVPKPSKATLQFCALSPKLLPVESGLDVIVISSLMFCGLAKWGRRHVRAWHGEHVRPTSIYYQRSGFANAFPGRRAHGHSRWRRQVKRRE